eukprot:751310-Hanusia_phi.AAC.3
MELQPLLRHRVCSLAHDPSGEKLAVEGAAVRGDSWLLHDATADRAEEGAGEVVLGKTVDPVGDVELHRPDS